MSSVVRAEPIEILLVEDNPGDVRLMTEAFKDARIRNRLRVASDGPAALDVLRSTGVKRPDLILLDLNLPGMSGHEVLEAIKADPDLQRIPVVIVTSSSADRDIFEACNNCANGYVTKPVDLAEYLNIVRSIEAFWLTIEELPPA